MLLMMGSSEALPSAPIVKTQFIEDMSDAQLAKAVNIFTFPKLFAILIGKKICVK